MKDNARQGRHHQSGRGASAGRRAGILQHLALHPARSSKTARAKQQLKADFEAYLDGFSPNVQEILDNFEFRNQIPTLSKADALGTLIEKFLDPSINLGPNPSSTATAQ